MRISKNPTVDEGSFYKRLALLSIIHSIEKDRYYRIDRLRGPSQPSLKETRDWTGDKLKILKEDEDLRHFLDCLAEICANKHNGSTVTAVTIHRPGPDECPQYIFASNGRSDDDNEMESYINYVLTSFGNLNKDKCLPRLLGGVLETHRDVSGQILLFNRSRLKVYLNKILRCLNNLKSREEDLDETGMRASF